MVFTVGTIVGIVGVGLSLAGTITSGIGANIKAKEKEAREIEELDARNNTRWNNWISDKSPKDY